MGLFNRKIRYAVVGLGNISQRAAIPGLFNTKNSKLTALVSGTPEKLSALGERYGIEDLYDYEEFDDCLSNDRVDAIYIGTPNNKHHDLAIRAARAGVHVLCEKPMEIDSTRCMEMIEAAKAGRVKLMIAYRLHFEPANLKAAEIVQSGRIGEPLFFQSSFGFLVKPDNPRLKASLGGGPLWDIGIYCINAARYLFREEPSEVFAFEGCSGRDRFREVSETVSVTMRFPSQKTAAFTCSFGSAPVGRLQVVGTQGQLQMEDPFSWKSGKKMILEENGEEKSIDVPLTDQFGAEIQYFSNCIRKNIEPEPDGYEGLADVKIINAIHRSLEEERPVSINWGDFRKRRYPDNSQRIILPPIDSPDLIEAETPGDQAA